jgi:hypothetical protein
MLQAKCYHGREFVFGAGGHAPARCDPPQNELSEVNIKAFTKLFKFSSASSSQQQRSITTGKVPPRRVAVFSPGNG